MKDGNIQEPENLLSNLNFSGKISVRQLLMEHAKARGENKVEEFRETQNFKKLLSLYDQTSFL